MVSTSCGIRCAFWNRRPLKMAGHKGNGAAAKSAAPGVSSGFATSRKVGG